MAEMSPIPTTVQRLKPLLLLWLLILMTANCDSYFADFTTFGNRPNEPTCVNIPKNMSLCSDIGYDKMRLPNLLDHDTLAEVQQQSGSWVPLLNVRCHKDTKLFLCSLFTPVCLESPIYPCRSLCEAVQKGCEDRMKTYGYDWPHMLSCDRFPMDDDNMCIKSFDQKDKSHNIQDNFCSVCSPADTYENVLDNYCRSDFVIRARIKRQRGPKVTHRKIKIYKSDKRKKNFLRRSNMVLEGESACCSFIPGKQKYLIMGSQKGYTLNPTFVLPWRRTKSLRRAVKMFSSIDCEDPNLFSTFKDGEIKPETELSSKKRKKKWRRARKKKKNRENRRNKSRKQNRRTQKIMTKKKNV